MTSPDDNKDAVRKYLKAFNDRDWDTLREHLADDVVEHGIHETLRGPDEVVEFLDHHFRVFPDYSGETEAMVAEDDLVTVRYSARGTHTGEFRDVEPTGRTVDWTGMAMYRVEDDLIAEVWVEEDRLALLEELEDIGPPAHLRI